MTDRKYGAPGPAGPPPEAGDLRLEHLAREQAEVQRRRARFLGKWLHALLWVEIAAIPLGLLLRDSVLEEAVSVLLFLVRGALFLKMADQEDAYLPAGAWTIAYAVLSVPAGLLSPLLVYPALAVPALLAAAALSAVCAHFECRAHQEALLGVDQRLSALWEKIRKCSIALSALAVLPALLMGAAVRLGLSLLLAVALAGVALSIVRLACLCLTARALSSREPGAG